ncbi:MAG: cytochrome P450, partial [Burkholderiales bacterium]|nr:cytochrome P450 [Burkholderiales bacterium]
MSSRPDLQPGAVTLRALDELPGPPGLPFLGNVLQIKPKECHRLWGAWAEEFGDLFVFRLGTKRVLCVADADLIQQLLRDRPERIRRWRKMEEIALEIKGNGLFTAEGARWRRERKFVMHALNAGHVREFIPRLEQVVGRLRRKWWRAALAGECIDVHADLMRLTVDVTTGLAFGRDLNTIEEKADPIQNHLDKLFPAIARRQTALFPYWRYIRLPADRELDDAVAEVRKVLDGLITEARVRLTSGVQPPERPRNLLEALVAAQQQDEQAFDDDEIANNLMTILLAGEDTTANSLSYLMHFLMEYPEVQARVQEEVDRVIGLADRPWQDAATPDKLKYVEAVANETMRCKPVGAHLFLEPTEDMRVGDVHVPAGTPILVLNGHVGSQEQHFTQADQFRPERWLESDEDAGDHAHNMKAFMPFGSGPRFCPGRQLAMLQIKMVVSMLCRDFEAVRPAGAPPLQDIYNFTVGPVNVSALLRPRRQLQPGIDIDFRTA